MGTAAPIMADNARPPSSTALKKVPNTSSVSNDVVGLIVQSLDARSLALAQRVCKLWREAARSERLWQVACASAWPSTALLAEQRLLPGGCRSFYSRRKAAEARTLSGERGGSAGGTAELSNLTLLVDVSHAGATVCSRQLPLACDEGSTELLLEDEGVCGLLDASWEDWSEQRQEDGCWSISIAALRHADYKIAHLASTPGLPRYRERVQPKAKWSGNGRVLVFGHNRNASMPGPGAVLKQDEASGSVWDGRSLPHHCGPLDSQYVIAPRLELQVRPSQGWDDPFTCALLLTAHSTHRHSYALPPLAAPLLLMH